MWGAGFCPFIIEFCILNTIYILFFICFKYTSLIRYMICTHFLLFGGLSLHFLYSVWGTWFQSLNHCGVMVVVCLFPLRSKITEFKLWNPTHQDAAPAFASPLRPVEWPSVKGCVSTASRLCPSTFPSQIIELHASWDGTIVGWFSCRSIGSVRWKTAPFLSLIVTCIRWTPWSSTRWWRPSLCTTWVFSASLRAEEYQPGWGSWATRGLTVWSLEPSGLWNPWNVMPILRFIPMYSFLSGGPKASSRLMKAFFFKHKDSVFCVIFL